MARPVRTASAWAALLVAVLVVAAVAAWLAAGRDDGRSPTGPPTTAATTAATSCDPPPAVPTTYATFDHAPDPTAAGASVWHATIRTTCGSVDVRLDGRAAPASVASFVELARAGYYTNSVCNRLTSRLAPTRFLQCGDPTGRRLGDPGYDLPLENVPADRRYRVGTVAIARGPEVGTTAGEFVIVYEDFTVPPGDPTYSVVGQVVSGQEVVSGIAAAGGEDHLPDWFPFRSISIRSVEVQPQQVSRSAW